MVDRVRPQRGKREGRKSYAERDGRQEQTRYFLHIRSRKHAITSIHEDTA